MKKLNWALSLLLLFHWCVAVSRAREQPMNVLWLVVDDMAAIGSAYGDKGIVTPNIDRLADEGRLFSNAYCQAALCNPSRASVMTGVRPDRLGIWTNEPHFRGIFPSIKTLPQLFKSKGHRVVSIGKIYHNWRQSIQGDPESWHEPEVNHYATHSHDTYVPGRPYRWHRDVSKPNAYDAHDVPDQAYVDGRTADLAVLKLRELQETPFFLAVGFWKPHLPFNAPKKYWDLYDADNLPKSIGLEETRGIPEIALADSPEARNYGAVPKEGRISKETHTKLRHGYLAAISYVDAQVGKVLDELDALGLRDKTAIVFYSDHGYHGGDFGHWGKLTNFEIGTRVPLVISIPGIAYAGQPCSSVVELLDLYPTLVDLFGLNVLQKYPKIQGQSLVEMIDKPDAESKGYAISQIARPPNTGANFESLGTTLRTNSHRYTKWVDVVSGSLLAEELYDLTKDRKGLRNIAGDSAESSKLKDMREQTVRLLAK